MTARLFTALLTRSDPASLRIIDQFVELVQSRSFALLGRGHQSGLFHAVESREAFLALLRHHQSVMVLLVGGERRGPRGRIGAGPRAFRLAIVIDGCALLRLLVHVELLVVVVKLLEIVWVVVRHEAGPRALILYNLLQFARPRVASIY